MRDREKKEAFVQNRFAQLKTFGQKDIVTWLAREREVARPHIPEEPTTSLVSQWQRLPGTDLLRLTSAKEAIALVRANATPCSNFANEQVYPRVGNWTRFIQLIGTHEGGAEIYIGHFAFVVLVQGREFYALRVTEGTEHAIEGSTLLLRPFAYIPAEYTSRVVADVLLAEWDRCRSRASGARKVLCDAVARRVASERQQAQRMTTEPSP